MKNIFLYIDKKGAEWVVVAFLAGDKRMMEVCQTGGNPHAITASHMFNLAPETILKERKLLDGVSGTIEIRNKRAQMADELATAPFLPAGLPLYDCGKRSNHGLNYKEGYKGFALINGIMENEAKRIVEGYSCKREVTDRMGRRKIEYTGVYPGIARCPDETEQKIRKDRFLTNCWGRKIPFMGIMDSNLFRKGYSAVPQSTVVDLVNRAMVNAFRTRSPHFARAQILQQTHDSLTYQYPLDALDDAALFLSELAFQEKYLNPIMSYDDRPFRIGNDLKIGFTLGAMFDCPLFPDPEEQRFHLTEIAEKAKATSPYFIRENA